NLALQLKGQTVHLGVFHGFEFAWARKTNPDLKPLMIAIAGKRATRAILVVPHGSPMAKTEDLQGKTLALPLLVREHCRLFVERRCIPDGSPMGKWFGRVTTPKTSECALDDVADGYAQATVVDDVELTAYRNAHPKTAERLRV